MAAPGCYATASILALAPLLASGLAEPADIVIVAASGTSGAGRAPAPNLMGSEVMGAVSAYKAGGVHRHTPEIEEALQGVLAPDGAGARVTISFTPTLAPMPRGILATATARLAGEAAAAAATAARDASATGDAAAAGDAYATARAAAGDAAGNAAATARAGEAAATTLLRESIGAAYAGETFVHLLPEGYWPGTGATAGSNAAQLQAAADTHAGRAVVVSAIDNLGKGAAGQALQNANLMLGLPESAGLTAYGVAP